MNVKKLTFVVALVVGICLFFSASQAARKVVAPDSQVRGVEFSKAVPGQLSYQGYLADAADSSAVSATLEMTFRLFAASSGGTELWSETHSEVVISDGLFQVLLGSQTAFPDGLFDGSQLWLQTEVGSEVLSPRKPVVSTAFSQKSKETDYATSAEWAIDAQHAIYADTAQYGLSGGGWTVDGADVYHESGKVGIGTATPATELDVNGSVNAATYYGDGSHLTGISGTSDGDWIISGDDISTAVSGKVGIGITPPDAKLHVRSGSGVGQQLKLGDGNQPSYEWVFDADASANLNITNEGDGSPVTALCLKSDGKVGIGTTTPAEMLGVAGIIHSTTGGFKFPDGTTQVTAAAGGTGDGHSLDADDGNPVDALYVDADGDVGIGTASPVCRLDVQGTISCTDSLVISSPPRDGVKIDAAARNGMYVTTAGTAPGSIYWADPCGYQVAGAESYGYYAGRVSKGGLRVYNVGSPSGSGSTGLYNGLEVRAAEGSGLAVGYCDSAGVYINSTGSHGVVVVEPEKSGLYVSTPEDYGVFVDSSVTDGIFIQDTADNGIQIEGAHSAGLVILSPENQGVYISSSANDGMYVNNAGSNGAYLDIGSGSVGWAVYAHSNSFSGNGIYCYGNGTISGSWSKTVTTSKGWEAVQTLSAPDEEIVASGMGRLVNGRCRIRFERLFSEAISHRIPVKIVLTPLDRWSGLYAAERSYEGFTVLTGAGAQDVEFTWRAIGRRQGYEQRPVVNIPDPEAENARLEAEAREQRRKQDQRRYTRKTSRREESTAILSEDGRPMEQVAE
jgi:hypothetical protein